MQTEFQYLQVESPIPSPAVSFRGTVAGEAEIAMQVAAVGLMGVFAIGETAMQAVRASGSCDRRRGRPQLDIQGNPIIPPALNSGHLSIVSQPDFSHDSVAGAQWSGNGVEPEEWKVDKERMQNIIQQQSDDASKLLTKPDEMKKTMDKFMVENLDLKHYIRMEREKTVSTVEHGYHVKSISQMEKCNPENDAKISLLEY